MRLVGANASASGQGLNPQPGVTNYLVGNPSQWHTGVANYSSVQFNDVYQGVNVVYHGNQQQVEYDFTLAPGADVGSITLSFQGQQGMSLDPQGNLVLQTNDGSVIEQAPVVYQQSADGSRTPINGQYVLEGNGQVGFQVGSYDPTKALIIDPTLSFSTYLGPDNFLTPAGIAVDASGNVYVTGQTASSNYPTTESSHQATVNPAVGVAFVTKLDSSGHLLWSTLLGGSDTNNQANIVGANSGQAIAVDASGDPIITGFTSSSDFPTTSGAFQSQLGGGGTAQNAFVTKLSGDGASLLYSTYLGGDLKDFGRGIAVDASGNAFVTGDTQSTDFPTAGANARRSARQ